MAVPGSQLAAGRRAALRQVELVITIAKSACPATLLGMWSAVDLHLHTTHSDGKGSPEEVVRAAHQRGIGMLAITDHNTVAGFRAARQEGRPLGISVLPGVELTCPSGGSAVHLLGVFSPVKFDPEAVSSALKLEEAGLGDPAGVVPYSLINAVKRIHDVGGLAIAPHASARRGLLKEYHGPSRRWVAPRIELDAIELPEARNPYRPVTLPAEFAETPVISGSDAHELADGVSMSHRYGPGARPFWAMMNPSPNFLRLRFALEAGYVGVVPPLLALRGKARIDALLKVDEHFVRAIADDRGRRHQQDIRNSAVQLLNGDGGHLLVGARRRFQGATRGAALEMTLDELHDFVADAINPTPVLRAFEWRAANGPIHELVVLPAENPGRAYALRPRAQAQGAARADREALERLGVLDRTGFRDALDAKAAKSPDGTLPVEELVRVFPYRDWLVDDPTVGQLVARSLARLILVDPAPPRWSTRWARELPRARLEFRSAFRELVKRSEGRRHRQLVRDVLAERVRDRATRRTIEQWLEGTQARVLDGGAVFEPAEAELEPSRERAVNAFGDEVVAELHAEQDRAVAQYRAAVQNASGVLAEPVISAGEHLPGVSVEQLQEAGIATVVLAGAEGGGAVGFAVPDELSQIGAPELLAIWAARDLPSQERIPGLIQRAIESGKHLPVMRLVSRMRRAQLEQLIADIETEQPGATHTRHVVLRDLRELLAEPEPSSPEPDPDVLDALNPDGLTAKELKPAADYALHNPEAVAERLDAETQAEVLRLAAPGNPQPVRRPALVLAGALGDEALLEYWDEETAHQVRLNLVEGIALLPGPDGRVDTVLFEALTTRAGLVQRAARALAGRGAEGYEALRARLPSNGRECWYVVAGVAEVAELDPDAAREIGVSCAPSGMGDVLDGLRRLDRALYLRPTQERLSEQKDAPKGKAPRRIRGSARRASAAAGERRRRSA